MKEQCQILRVIGENQQKLAEIMQGVVEPPPTGVGSGPGGISPPAPGFTPCFPPGTAPPLQSVPVVPPI